MGEYLKSLRVKQGHRNKSGHKYYIRECERSRGHKNGTWEFLRSLEVMRTRLGECDKLEEVTDLDFGTIRSEEVN